MNFIEMRDMLNEHIKEMMASVDHMFEVQVDKDEMYNLYLDSFPKGTNEIYRERREHDCSCCRGFIKNIGNVITIKNGVVDTIWNIETNDTTYAPVLKALDAYVRKHAVTDVFLSVQKKIGCHHNFEIIEKMSPKQWDHFYIELDDKFCIEDGTQKGALLNNYGTGKEVFKRALEEITLDAVDTVIELIESNSLYRGEEHIGMIRAFRKSKMEYSNLDNIKAKDLYAWEHSVAQGQAISRIRNTSIGTLLVDISEGKELDSAVASYEAMVAPANYKRSKPIYSKKQLEEAQKLIEEQGYMESLPRRHATLDDITVNDILFCDKSVSSRVGGADDIFSQLAKTTKDAGEPKKFSRVEEISIDDFIANVLPGASKVEAFVDNAHRGNFVSLIAPKNKDAKCMFKWGNNFTWAYAGNMTDSMKDRVKAFGGDVNGDLRFSIQWNECGTDNCDLDAHCITATGAEIYYSHKHDSSTNGELDVDIIHPGKEIAVENITWASRRRMKDGTYKFFVHQFSGSVKNGFRAEIEFDGKIYNFDYPHSMRSGEDVQVATVTLKDGEFTIKTALPSSQSKQTIWGIETMDFVPVSVICYSPNYWENADKKTGHKHVFFMLDKCVNDENPSGIFNEFLVQELYEHRRVMEAIGGKMRVEDTTDQLSGLGFATDKSAELVVKVTGATERVMKIKF